MKTRLEIIIIILYFSVLFSLNNVHAAFISANFSLNAGEVGQSSPTLADVDNDGIDEVIIATKAWNPAKTGKRPMRLVVMRGNGSVLWSRNVGAPVNSAPAVGDIDNDGDVEILVSIGGDASDKKYHGGIKAFDHRGNLLWTFNTLDDYPADGYANGVFSSPTLCDVDGDGDMEIAFGGWDRNIYLLSHNGVSLWNNMPGARTGQGFHNGDTIWSTAACADLNSDGSKEIIIGADITGGGILPDGYHTQDGGFLYVFDRNGQILVRKYLPETIFSSPAVGDLDRDGQNEIVVGTGYYWWNKTGRTRQPYVYSFDTSLIYSNKHYSDPTKLPNVAGWPRPTTYPGFSSPALADLDNDGDLEVIIGSGDPYNQLGQVHVWHHNGSNLAGWPVSPRNGQGRRGYILSSPTIADIDHDGSLEVLFSMLWDVQIYSTNGTRKNLLHTTWTVSGSPAIGNADGDDRVDIWIGGGNYYEQNNGYIWRFESDTASIGARPWPMFHGDAENSGTTNDSKGKIAAIVSIIKMLLLSE